MEAGPSQLAAAVVALIATLVARCRDSSGLLRAAWAASPAHWALEALVIAEAELLADALDEIKKSHARLLCNAASLPAPLESLASARWN